MDPMVPFAPHALRRSSVEDGKSYIKKHEVHTFLDKLVAQLVEEQPTDPYDYIMHLAQQQKLVREIDCADNMQALMSPASRPSGKVPPLNIVILIVGSRGDVQPFVAFGQRLQKHGHRVRIATHVTFRDFVRKHGLDFFPLRGDPSELMRFMVENPQMISFSPLEIEESKHTMAEIYESALLACTTPTIHKPPFVPDVLISNPPVHVHIHLAEYFHIPLHVMFTMPWSPTSAYQHPLASKALGSFFSNYQSYHLVDSMIWMGLGGKINDFRHNCLKMSKLRSGADRLRDAAIPHLYCYSPNLAPKPPDWGDLIDVVGFWFLDKQTDFSAEQKVPNLHAFLQSGSPPVYIGFGSIVSPDAAKLSKAVVDGVTKAGVRAILHQGWAKLGEGLTVDESKVFKLAEPVPHDWLFPLCSAVCHHGGAGTTAAGLYAGKPTIVIPFFGDQPFWGHAIASRGVGPEPIHNSKLTGDNFCAALKFCVASEVRTNAEQLGFEIRSEDGVNKGVEAFHNHLPMDNGVWEVDVWEHQRWYPIKGWSSTLLPHDPHKLSDCSGKLKRDMDSFHLPTGWTWKTNWIVRKAVGTTDEDGWQYGTCDKKVKKDGPSSSSKTLMKWQTSPVTAVLRRRQWVRTRLFDYTTKIQEWTAPAALSTSQPITLYVTAKEGEALEGHIDESHADPFLELSIPRGPTTTQMQRTKVIENTANPKWNQQFYFQAFAGDILKITCFDHDVLTKNDLIGAASLHLDQLVAKGLKLSTTPAPYKVELQKENKVCGKITLEFSL